jgi:hypothetical protein
MPDDAVHQLAAFPDLGYGFCCRIDREIFQFVGPLKIGICSNAYVLYDFAIFYYRPVADGPVKPSSIIEFPVAERSQYLLQFPVVTVPAAQPGISR